jgi:hypothetical protein
LTRLQSSLHGEVRTLRVDRLPASEARELAQRLLGGQDADARLLADAAAGHPMFIETLTRQVGAAHLRLDDALRAQAGALEPRARALLSSVCLAGRPVPLAACASAAGVAVDDVAALVGVLRAGHLVSSHGLNPSDAIEPYHDRVREAVVAGLDVPTRTALHLGLARALAAHGGVDPELLAGHFQEGGDAASALDHAERAAERAAAALAFDQAARLYALARGLARDADRAALLAERLADTLANAGRGQDAAAAYLAAAERPGAHQLELRRRAAEQLLSSGRIEGGLRVLRGVLDSVGLSLPRTPRGALASLLANRARLWLRGGALAAKVRPGIVLSPELAARIDTCWSVGLGLAFVDTIRGADFQSRHIRMAVAAGEPYRLACALAAEAGFSAVGGGPARAHTLELVARARSLAAEVGHPNPMGFAAFAAGAADYLSGLWKSGLRLCDEAEHILRTRCTGATWWCNSASFFALESLAYLGDFHELRRRVPRALDSAQGRQDLYAANVLRTGMPNLAWLAAGDVEQARAQIEMAKTGWVRDTFHIQHLGQLLGDMQVDLYAGDGASAHRRVSAAWPAIQRAGVLRIQLTRIVTWHQRGRAALAAGALGNRDALVLAAHVAQRLMREAMPWSDPLGRLLAAGAAHIDKRPDLALAELSRAAIAFRAVDMEAYAAAADLRAGQLLGGDAGAAQVAAAAARLRELGCEDPDRMAAVLAPGF